MATAVSFPMSLTPFNNTSQCEPDVEEWLNFSDLPSTTPTNNGASSSKMPASTVPSAMTSPATTIAPLDGHDDYQIPAKPSHEYHQFKQQTGLPSGSVPGLQAFNPMGFSNTGLDDMSLMGNWSTGLGGMDADFNMDSDFSTTGLPAFFYPSGDSSQQDEFVDPSNISQPEEPANVRVWPGMHQQQALAKAQQAQAQQAQQQRQQQLLQAKRQMEQQQQQQQQTRSQSSRRSASHQPIDARTEETIARVVNQIRQNSQMASQQGSDDQDGLPHVIRMKKDEDDMDEDERLLASEEGKKLTSKERRQLRNKVSARAFRSRRKEYIGQLEGELAGKVSEANDLRAQNRALMEENARSRAFIEKLLRHQAFHPFLEDLSRDDSIQTRLPMMQSASSSNPSPPPPQKDANVYQAPQQFQASSHNAQIGMALVPETPIDMSILTLGNTWSTQNLGFNFNQPQVFAVTEIPQGPINPLNTESLSGKGYEAFEEAEFADEIKYDLPSVMASPIAEAIQSPKPAESESDRAFDNDPAFCLYHDTEATTPLPMVSTPFEDATGFPEKSAQFELVVSSVSSERALERVARLCAMMEPAYLRLREMTSDLE